MNRMDITKKELEEAVKDGRVDIVHVLGEDANKVCELVTP